LVKSGPYQSIAQATTPVLLKERHSKFIGQAFPLREANDYKIHLEQLWREHPSATHICWAAITPPPEPVERANDDGEPAHSAGTPILGQIKNRQLQGCLVTVVRYYGGVKLGVPGLIQAYKQAAALALDEAMIVDIEPMWRLQLEADYSQMSKVMRWMRTYEALLVEQNLQERCQWTLDVKIRQMPALMAELEQSYGIRYQIDVNGPQR